MSFRIHSTPAQPTACMIRVKHHQRPTELALAQLEADEEYEVDHSEHKAEDKHVGSVEHDESKQTPLPAVIAPIHPAHAAAAASLAASQPSQDETFKLRRKRRV